jgi:hypothetical protein
MLELGDHVMLLIDGNPNMKASNLSKELQALTFREVIKERHGVDRPATHKQNSNKVPIDGIWATQGIQIERGGYFPYDQVFANTDHRCLWVDVTYTTAFGYNMAPLHKKKARRLHCKDLRLIVNYNALFHQFAMSHKLFECVTS